MRRTAGLSAMTAMLGLALAGPASAQNLLASSPAPAVFFDGTQLGLPGGAEWYIYANTLTDINLLDLAIVDNQQPANNVILLQSSPNSDSSLVVQPSGNVVLAN